MAEIYRIDLRHKGEGAELKQIKDCLTLHVCNIEVYFYIIGEEIFYRVKDDTCCKMLALRVIKATKIQILLAVALIQLID